MSKTTDEINTEYGKVPPQAIDIEEAVLGAIMIDNVIDTVSFLTTGCFYVDSHQKIFQCALDMHSENKNIDILTITEGLRARNQLDLIGGAVYITGLTRNVMSSAHVEYHAKILYEKFVKREFIRYGSELQQISYDDTVDLQHIIDFAESNLSKIVNTDTTNEPVKLIVEMLKLTDQLEKQEKNEGELIGIPSGIVDLDRVTSGWEEGDMIVIGARPSMGKTALAIQFAINAINIVPVYFVSLEMTNIQLTKRILANDSEIKLSRINNASDIDWVAVEKSVKKHEDSPLYLDDSSTMSATQLRSKIRKMNRKFGVKLVIIDYLQLMSSSRYSEPRLIVQECSRAIKQVAKELKISIIALSQLNREAEGVIPKKNMLKEAGDIEQDADKILFPVRNESLNNSYDSEAPGMIIVSKNRNGKIGDVDINISEDKTRWSDFNTYEEEIQKEHPRIGFHDDAPF